MMLPNTYKQIGLLYRGDVDIDSMEPLEERISTTTTYQITWVELKSNYWVSQKKFQYFS